MIGSRKEALMPCEKLPDYARLSELTPVPVIQDWSALTPDEFVRTYADQPVIFQRLATRWPAFRKWTPEFLVQTIGTGTKVKVRQPIALGGAQQQWSARVPMGVFAAEVHSVPGLYMAEWYPHSHRPELLADIGPVPDFLDETGSLRSPTRPSVLAAACPSTGAPRAALRIATSTTPTP